MARPVISRSSATSRQNSKKPSSTGNDRPSSSPQCAKVTKPRTLTLASSKKAYTTTTTFLEEDHTDQAKRQPRKRDTKESSKRFREKRNLTLNASKISVPLLRDFVRHLGETVRKGDKSKLEALLRLIPVIEEKTSVSNIPDNEALVDALLKGSSNNKKTTNNTNPTSTGNRFAIEIPTIIVTCPATSAATQNITANGVHVDAIVPFTNEITGAAAANNNIIPAAVVPADNNNNNDILSMMVQQPSATGDADDDATTTTTTSSIRCEPPPSTSHASTMPFSTTTTSAESLLVAAVPVQVNTISPQSVLETISEEFKPKPQIKKGDHWPQLTTEIPSLMEDQCVSFVGSNNENPMAWTMMMMDDDVQQQYFSSELWPSSIKTKESLNVLDEDLLDRYFAF